MIFIYLLILTAIFSYTAIWLWYIKAYMQYDFSSEYKKKMFYELETDDSTIIEEFNKTKEERCSTIVKMILFAGPFAWIVLFMVFVVGKILRIVDSDYEKTGTNIL